MEDGGVLDLAGGGSGFPGYGRCEVRERLYRLGARALTAPELLGLLLGNGVCEAASVELGARILDRFGSVRRTASRTMSELMGVPGIDADRAERVHAAFALLRVWAEEALPRGTVIQSSADLFERYHAELRDLRREVFMSVLLDGKNRVLREDRVSVGTLTSAVSTRGKSSRRPSGSRPTRWSSCTIIRPETRPRPWRTSRSRTAWWR